MVSNVANISKKCPPNIRTPSVHSPALVSPISVAHRNKMLENEGGAKNTNNWMRDQWVANLKKKRMATVTNGGVVPNVQMSSRVMTSGGGGGNSNNSAGSRATKSGGRNNSRRKNNSKAEQQHQQQQQQQNLTIPPLVSHSHLFGEKDSLGLSHPAMFFNDLGCFEIESQSFTRLTPSTRDFDHLLSGPATTDDGSLINANSYSVNDNNSNNNTTTSSSTTNRATTSKSKGGAQKKSVKPLLKKRTNCLALEVNQPKPRTPRRKLNCGNAFEDFDTQSSSTQCFSSVGTPSNFNTEVSHMWGHDLDFGSGSSYVDTFLDLPTPKSAEMPIMQGDQYTQSSSQHNTGGSSSGDLGGRQHHLDDDLSLPKLVRTNSIEQEGLSHFFEQTTLGGGGDNHSNNSDLYQQQHMSRHPPAHHHQIKKNQIDLGPSSSASPYSQAAMGVVDECFSKMMSPRAPRRNSLLAPGLGSSLSSSIAQYNSLSRLLSSTPRGAHNNLRTPRGPNGEYNFDHKNMPEFETLLDEYKFTDIDQELDSFYLDTIESFGGDLDLISN